MRRRSYSSPDAIPTDLHGQRRAQGGARREASDRVAIRLDGREFDGWTLNVSRGGARVIVEEQVEPGAEVDITIGDEAPRRARVIWVQDEADGQIAGFQFLDGSGSEPPPPSAG